jgi:catechol 2,3-dioxygenase-like lactoylglutathione lyase family enzyme
MAYRDENTTETVVEWIFNNTLRVKANVRSAASSHARAVIRSRDPGPRLQWSETHMINGTHHSALCTDNLERLVTFYRDVLGFRVVAEGAWDTGSSDLDAVVGLPDSKARVTILWTGNSHLEILEYANPVPAPLDASRRACDIGLSHIAFDVTDIDSEYERLSQAGVVFTTPPLTLMDGAARSTYASDVDGNAIEFVEVLEWEAIRIPDLIRYKGASRSS